MKFRTLLHALLALLAAVTSSQAIDIQKARYGRDEKYLDVIEVLRAHVRNNRYSFRVTRDSMGGDRNPGKSDSLYIEYRVEGRTYKDTVREGEVFTFQGVRGVAPARSFLGIIPPVAPSVATLRITNETRSTVLVYALDRYGRWGWEGELPPGRAFAATAVVGQQWRVTSRANEEIESITIRPGANSVALTPPAPPMSTGPVRLRFDNSFRDLLYVYKLDRWGGWEWVSRLDPGASYSVNGMPGENWIVIDRNGRTVRQFQVAPGMSTVRCGP